LKSGTECNANLESRNPSFAVDLPDALAEMQCGAAMFRLRYLDKILKDKFGDGA